MRQVNCFSRRRFLKGAAAIGSSLCLTAPSARAEKLWLTLPPTPPLPEPSKSGLVEINGTNIFFAQFGSGAPILMLHGGLGNSNYWGHQIGELARDYLVTVMDTRGHGRSPVMSRSFEYTLFAKDAVALLDFLNIPAASVVGWSDGAITGLELAMTRPDRVSRLFAFGANASLDGLKVGGSGSPLFASYAARCKAEYSRLSPHPEKWPDLVAGLRVMWHGKLNFTTQKLSSIGMPVTVSLGAYDELIRPDHAEHIAQAIPNARLALLPEVSHFAMLQDPAKFNAALREFLVS